MSSSERAEQLVTQPGNAQDGPLIVLAEDDEASRRGYGLILRHFGFRVVDADSGEDAIELMRVHRPDLVLMDIGLPVIDGWQASRIIKADSTLSSIPLVAFSGRIDGIADLRARSSFDGFIRKPVSPAELVRRVNAYLAFCRPGRDSGVGGRE